MPSDYVSLPTVTLMQGFNIWPLPEEYVELVLLQFNKTLEQYPHNLTYEQAYVRPCFTPDLVDTAQAYTTVREGRLTQKLLLM